MNDLPEDVTKVIKIYQNHNIGKIFISGISVSTQTNADISNINKKYTNFVKKNNVKLTKHPQITTDCLWYDSICLQDTGKSLLGKDLISRVSRFFCKNNPFLTSPHFQETIL